MALFENTRKPKDIYAKGTATVNAQNKMGKILSPSPNAVDVNKFKNGPGANSLNKIGTAFLNGRRKQKDYFAKNKPSVITPKVNTEGNKSGLSLTRSANAATAAPTAIKEPTMMLGHAATKQTSPVPPIPPKVQNSPRDLFFSKKTGVVDMPKKNTLGQNNTGRLSVNLSDHDLAVKDSISKIDARIAEGFKPTPEQADRIQGIRERAGFLRGGTDRKQVGRDGLPIQSRQEGIRGKQKVGNLDVTFDRSIPQADRRAFTADAPTGPQPTREDAQKQWLGRQLQGSGQASSRNANEIINPSPKESTRGWKAQLEIDKQKMQNEQSGRNNFNDNMVRRLNSRDNNAVNREANTIDAGRVAAQNKLNDAQVKNNEFELGRAEEMAKVQDAYIKSTDPKVKRALEKQIVAMGGKAQPREQMIKRNVYDEGGFVVGQEVMTRDDSGNLVPVQEGGEAVSAPNPPDAKNRVVGKIYDTPKGKMMWNARGWVKVGG